MSEEDEEYKKFYRELDEKRAKEIVIALAIGFACLLFATVYWAVTLLLI